MTDLAEKYKNHSLGALQAVFQELTRDAATLTALFNQKNLTVLDVLRTRFSRLDTYGLFTLLQREGEPGMSEAAIKEIINKFSPNVCAEKIWVLDEINRRALL